MKASAFLQALDDGRIVRAVREAESRTSGEIRVFVSRRRLGRDDVTARAQAELHRSQITATRRRNGVLVYVVPSDRAFAVAGDEAVHAKCGPSFWTETAAAIEKEFRAGRFTEGLEAGIRRAGELLAAHFPSTDDDRNELPDEIGRDG